MKNLAATIISLFFVGCASIVSDYMSEAYLHEVDGFKEAWEGEEVFYISEAIEYVSGRNQLDDIKNWKRLPESFKDEFFAYAYSVDGPTACCQEPLHGEFVKFIKSTKDDILYSFVFIRSNGEISLLKYSFIYPKFSFDI